MAASSSSRAGMCVSSHSRGHSARGSLGHLAPPRSGSGGRSSISSRPAAPTRASTRGGPGVVLKNLNTRGMLPTATATSRAPITRPSSGRPPLMNATMSKMAKRDSMTANTTLQECRMPRHGSSFLRPMGPASSSGGVHACTITSTGAPSRASGTTSIASLDQYMQWHHQRVRMPSLSDAARCSVTATPSAVVATTRKAG
mmetsp:Transcript_14375/g.43439  ORF Transcript_14375/g.43439 Transcript_14375/m.43439 type:complete len:200 (+) Transcript_14375:116-715(+)